MISPEQYSFYLEKKIFKNLKYKFEDNHEILVFSFTTIFNYIFKKYGNIAGEYATKSPLVLTEENKDQVEIYDCHENYSINVSEKTIQELAKILADIAAN